MFIQDHALNILVDIVYSCQLECYIQGNFKSLTTHTGLALQITLILHS